MSADLPAGLRRALPADTARSWVLLREVLPRSMVLHGGTAIAAHLSHRTSRDLDFFFDDPDIDLASLPEALTALRPTAVTDQAEHTLNAVFGQTKVQFLSMAGQATVDRDTKIAGLRVASLRDLAATKIKVIGDRGELRDYFDLMVIEQRTPVTVETALADYQARYNDNRNLAHLIRALGYLGDVADDPALPAARGRIERYWAARQPEILASFDQTGRIPRLAPGEPQPAPGPQPESGDAGGMVWVEPHLRNGRQVRGHYRRR
jgi:hypothetical protein